MKELGKASEFSAMSSGSEARLPSDRHGSKVGRSARSVRRAAHVPCWWKSSQTALQAGSEAKGGVNPSSGMAEYQNREERSERRRSMATLK